jgi:hypothetical protein
VPKQTKKVTPVGYDVGAGKPVKLFMDNLPDGLMRAFAAKCILCGVTMKETLVLLIEQWVKKG